MVSLAGFVDMRAYAQYRLQPCGDRHIRVMGGMPDRWPARYAAVSPAELLPLGVPQILIWGAQDSVVPESLFGDYERRSQAEIVSVAGAGHHDLCDPGGPAWSRIVLAVRKLLN